MRLRLVCVSLVLAASTSFAESVTYPLKPVAFSQPMPSFQFLNWSDKPPADAGAMPKLTGAHTWFAELKLGDGKPILVAASRSGAGKAAKTSLYVDTNGDRSLADEKPVVATKADTPGRQSVEELVTPKFTVPVVYDLPGGRVTRDLSLELTLTTVPSAGLSPMVMLHVDCAMGGAIKLGEQDIDVRLIDVDGDGKITIANGAEGPADMLWVNVTPKEPEAGEMRPLTRYLESNGRFYEIAPRVDGGEITVTPYEGALGKVTLIGTDAAGKPQPIGAFYLDSLTAMVMRENATGEVGLPPGTYGLTYGLGASKGGESEYSFSQTENAVRIAGGEAREIRCGGPLALSLQVQQQPAQAGVTELRVTLLVKNEAGHAFSARERDKEPPAKLAVLNAAGQVIARGNGQYG